MTALTTIQTVSLARFRTHCARGELQWVGRPWALAKGPRYLVFYDPDAGPFQIVSCKSEMLARALYTALLELNHEAFGPRDTALLSLLERAATAGERAAAADDKHDRECCDCLECENWRAAEDSHHADGGSPS